MTIYKGNIDKDSNPFVHESWIEQQLRFTAKRQGLIEPLFGKTVENILKAKPENDNRYVAFVAIRWGFAKIVDNKFTATEKWHHKDLYDGHGRPIIKK